MRLFQGLFYLLVALKLTGVGNYSWIIPGIMFVLDMIMFTVFYIGLRADFESRLKKLEKLYE